jgi:hypothetical protein
MADEKNRENAGCQGSVPTEFVYNRQKKDGVGIPNTKCNAQGNETNGDNNPTVKNERTFLDWKI